MNTATQYKGLVLVAGRSCNGIEEAGYKIVEHWQRMQVTRPGIPAGVELVILVSDDVDIFLTKYVRDLCEKELIPLVFVKKDLQNLEACIKKAQVVLEEQQEQASMVDAAKLEEAQMAENDGRSTGKNVQAKNAKLEVVREFLKKDPKTPTESIQTEIIKRFGKGLTPSTITKVREAEFGVKIGPRGTVRAGANQAVAIRPVRQAVAKMTMPAASGESLEGLLMEARRLIAAAGIDKVEFDSQGHVKIVGGSRELNLPQ